VSAIFQYPYSVASDLLVSGDSVA